MKTIRIAEYLRQYASNSPKRNSYRRMLRNNANKIEEFENFLGRDLYTSDFDDRMMEEYDFFLRKHPKNYRRSTINGFGSKLGEFLRKAEKDGYSIDHRYSQYSFPVGEVYSIALNEEEITAIYNLKNISKEQKVARYWFIIGCWTGLRFSDLKRIEDINITGDILHIRTQKTGTEVKVPAHWMVKELLKKHTNIPPLRTQQGFGGIVKRLCRAAKITDNVLIERHEGTRYVRKNVPKWKLVSAHTARRSFATNAYLSGIKTARIMLMTGHKTEDSFFKYIKIDKKENAKLLAKHDFFAGHDKTPIFKEKNLMNKSRERREKIANVIKDARILRDMTIEETALKAGCTPNTLKRIEKGIFSPSIEILCLITDAIEIEIKINNTLI